MFKSTLMTYLMITLMNFPTLDESYNLRKRMHVEYWLRNFERIYCWRLRLCMPNIAGRAKERHFHSGHKTILYSFLLCDF